LALDITDRSAITEFLLKTQPTHILNLAGIAAPTAAQADPSAAWKVNLHGTLELARATLQASPDCWLLNVGSGLIYGESAGTGQPLDEAAPLAPVDEYSATKAAADLALGVFARHGLRCIRLRPFNHTGSGQSEQFVVPAFAMQIARIEAGLAPPMIRVGNLDAQRDFLDVRDVASAYALVTKHAETLEPGSAFNVASGKSRRISEILDALLAKCRITIAVEMDPKRMRPSDLPVILGDAARARKAFGWRAEHAFDDTLMDIMSDARARVAR
jgi:GDP-4-dehydro-6-deoxy-D-mannose reductase